MSHTPADIALRTPSRAQQSLARHLATHLTPYVFGQPTSVYFGHPDAGMADGVVLDLRSTVPVVLDRLPYWRGMPVDLAMRWVFNGLPVRLDLTTGEYLTARAPLAVDVRSQ